MSRSYKQHPYFNFVGGQRASEKEDKKIWHKKFRRIEKAKLKKLINSNDLSLLENHLTTHKKEVSDPYDFVKDASHYYIFDNCSRVIYNIDKITTVNGEKKIVIFLQENYVSSKLYYNSTPELRLELKKLLRK